MSKDITLTARAYPFEEPKGNQLAFASVTINDSFAITGIKVMNGENGPFAAMPSTKLRDGSYKDICFPTTKELRAELNNVVINAYNVALEKMLGISEKESEKTPDVTVEVKEAGGDSDISETKVPEKPPDIADDKEPEKVSDVSDTKESEKTAAADTKEAEKTPSVAKDKEPEKTSAVENLKKKIKDTKKAKKQTAKEKKEKEKSKGDDAR